MAEQPAFDARNVMDGRDLLRSLPQRSVAAVFFDPQYRAGLDALSYGNEGNRQKERAKLPPMSDDMIVEFMEEIQRVLRPSGHLFLWMDKFSLWSAHWHCWEPEVSSLALVDGMIWDKDRIGMGKRTRCQYEAMAILQRGPRRAGGVWTDHRIADVWRGKPDRKRHAHAKPLDLIQRLILATTKPGELIADPAAGGYAVMEAAHATRRKFVGCDLKD